MANEVQTTAAARQEDRGTVIYSVAGQDIKLSPQIVKSYLTRGNGNITDQEVINFISICKYNQLNPFLNEAYLVKFGNSPASMIVSKEAFFKRAEENPKYDGIQAGIIVVTKDGEVKESEGSFKLEGEKLVGGWAKVYRADRKYPIVSRVSIEEYDKKQSNWNEKPSTMIAKVAKVQALREAFPTQLGALYTSEEQGVIEDVPYQEVEKTARANKKEVSIPEPNDEDLAPAPPHTKTSEGDPVVVTGSVKNVKTPF